jgi:hypothetical protein
MPHSPVSSQLLHSHAVLEVGEGAQPHRRGKGEVHGGWRLSNAVEGAVMIDGGIVRQAVGGDLLWENGSRSGSTMMRRAVASKRQRATGSLSHSTPELRPSLSTSQHRLRYQHLTLHLYLHDIWVDSKEGHELEPLVGAASLDWHKILSLDWQLLKLDLEFRLA